MLKNMDGFKNNWRNSGERNPSKTMIQLLAQELSELQILRAWERTIPAHLHSCTLPKASGFAHCQKHVR